MAVLHCVTVEWRPDVDRAEARAAFGRLLEALAGEVVGLVALRHGPSLGLPRSADHGAVLVFEDVEHFHHYTAHALHGELVDLLTRYALRRTHVQLAADPLGPPTVTTKRTR